jgi:hypothetical protein
MVDTLTPFPRATRDVRVSLERHHRPGMYAPGGRRHRRQHETQRETERGGMQEKERARANVPRYCTGYCTCMTLQMPLPLFLRQRARARATCFGAVSEVCRMRMSTTPDCSCMTVTSPCSATEMTVCVLLNVSSSSPASNTMGHDPASACIYIDLRLSWLDVFERSSGGISDSGQAS